MFRFKLNLLLGPQRKYYLISVSISIDYIFYYTHVIKIHELYRLDINLERFDKQNVLGIFFCPKLRLYVLCFLKETMIIVLIANLNYLFINETKAPKDIIKCK